MSHASAIRSAIAHLKKFDAAVGDAAEYEVSALKAEREFVSYRAPSSGDAQISERNRTITLCALLAEVAQFNSECFETSFDRNTAGQSFELLESYLLHLSVVEIGGHTFGDTEDAYRLGYLTRKCPQPVNLQLLMTEGHVEDFFGAWYAESDDELNFKPDEIQNLIFEIP